MTDLTVSFTRSNLSFSLSILKQPVFANLSSEYILKHKRLDIQISEKMLLFLGKLSPFTFEKRKVELIECSSVLNHLSYSFSEYQSIPFM